MTEKHSDFIRLKDSQWLARQKIAGRTVASVLKYFSDVIKIGQPVSLKTLEMAAAHQIELTPGCKPSFLGYRGFPGVVCLSVNEELVHGIPSDRILQDGDVVTMDVGVTYEGAVADGAATCIFGAPNPKHVEMLETCQAALQEAIQAIQIGKRLGVIGAAIYNRIKHTEFGLITRYGGHGLDYEMPHADPFVANDSRPCDGVRIAPGLSIAIEPMLVLNKDVSTKILDDKWTVVTNKIGCHFEHSVTIDQNGRIHIITLEDNNENSI